MQSVTHTSASTSRKPKTERVFRRWAEPSCVVRQPQDPVPNEYLFEDENFAEAGYSWEAFVFDGRIELDHLDASNPLMLSKWPSFLVSIECPQYH